MGGSSFAAPHVSVVIAKFIQLYGRLPYEQIVKHLKGYAFEVKNKNLMCMKSLHLKKRYVSSHNNKLYNIVKSSVQEVLQLELSENSQTLWQHGLNYFNCYDVLQSISKKLKAKLDYQAYHFFDFHNLNSLTYKTGQVILNSKNNIEYPKCN